MQSDKYEQQRVQGFVKPFPKRPQWLRDRLYDAGIGDVAGQQPGNDRGDRSGYVNMLSDGVQAAQREALTTGNFVNGLKLTYYSGTTLQGDYYDSTWSPANCASTYQISADECRIGHSIVTDYFFAYSGIRDLTLGAYVGNLFNAMPPFDRRAMEEGGRSLPQVGEVMRRTLHLSMSYKFK